MVTDPQCFTNRHFNLNIILLLLFFCTREASAELNYLTQRQDDENAQTPLLKGRKLHCCGMMQYPNLYLSPSKSRGFDGMAIHYLEGLEELLGFRCERIEKMSVKFTRFILEMEMCAKNDSYDSPICKCDLGVGGWMLTQQRIGRVHYLPPFVRDDMRVVVHVDNTYSGIGDPFFINTFTPSVWLAIAGLMLLWVFLKVLDKRFVPPDSSFKPLSRDVSWYKRKKHIILKSNLNRRLRKSFQSTAGRMIGHQDESVETVSPSTRQWTLNFVILLCGLFFVLIYEATMTANLVQESRQSDFRSMDDFKRCVIPPEDTCVSKGGAVNSFWDAITLEETCHKGRNVTLTSSYEGAVDMVANKSCKYLLIDGSSARYGTNIKHCHKIVTTGDPVYPASNSFVMPLNSDIDGILANGTLKLLEGDKLKSLEQYFKERGQCELTETTIITFNKLRVFFIAAYVVTALIFFEMVLDPQELEPIGRESAKVNAGTAGERADGNGTKNNNNCSTCTPIDQDEIDEENGQIERTV